MKTDSFFYRFFREFPEVFFALIGENERKTRLYKFSSVEVDEQASPIVPKGDRKNDRAIAFRH